MYLNVVQLAQSFGVSENTIEEWVRHEKLPHTHDQGRLIFDRQQVADWAAARGYTNQAGLLVESSASRVDVSRLDLAEWLGRGGVHRDVVGASLPDVLAAVTQTMTGLAPAFAAVLAQRARRADAVSMTGVGHGWALPHLATRLALPGAGGTAALLFLRAPIELDPPPTDRVPVERMLFFVAPTARLHLEVLARLGELLSDADARSALVASAADETLARIVGSTC